MHLLTGGPTWEERASVQAAARKPSKKEKAALRQLDASVQGLRVALRHRQLNLARQLRTKAWEQVDLLPSHLTWEQRRVLFEAKQAIQVLARTQGPST
ncbi:hypothetical protein ABTX82_01915 [Streptomyces lavendulae]|uniref:hypothetical protein n=1 Tax=Streptomyces lavendulae TaxID=1914 RepID=UPI003332AE70